MPESVDPAHEETLSTARAAIGKLIDGSPSRMCLVDEELRLLHVSAGSRKFLGCERIPLGKDLSEVLQLVWREAFAREVVARVRHTLSTGAAYVAPRAAAWRRNPSVLVIQDWRTERLALPGGRNGVVCHFHDVTEQRRLESALLDSEERLAAQLEAIFRLNEFSRIRIPTGKVETLYEYLLDAAMAIMSSQCASVQLLESGGDGNGGCLRLLAQRGFHPQSTLHWQHVFAATTTTCGVALRLGKRFMIVDVEQWDEAKGTADYDEFCRSGIRAVQSTPLLSRSGAPVGMLSTHWHRPYRPTEGEFRAFDILARQAADLLQASTEGNHAHNPRARRTQPPGI